MEGLQFQAISQVHADLGTVKHDLLMSQYANDVPRYKVNFAGSPVVQKAIHGGHLLGLKSNMSADGDA